MPDPTPRRPDDGSEPSPRLPPGVRSGWNWLLILLLALMAVSLLQRVLGNPPTEVSWSDLKSLVASGQIERAEVGTNTVVVYTDPGVAPEGSGDVEPIELAEGSGIPAALVGDDGPFSAARIDGDDTLMPLLETHGVAVRGVNDQGCAGAALGVFFLPTLLLIAFWLFILRRAGGPTAQAMTFGKSRAKLVAEEDIGVRFSDVAGVDEAREELAEVVEFLSNPEKFRRLGARIPTGVMLVGPPGTGKTLLARAVAGEAGVSFFAISGSDFVEMFVGVGAARVRDMFEQARQAAPCIIFLDELDAVGKARGAGNPMGGNDEREQTLNALLVEMDGFDERADIIVLAATNRPESLDPALLRPGRFDRQILVDRPDLIGRLAILRIHAQKIVLGDDVDLEAIAQQTTGMVGADLANVVNESALLAAREDATAVGQRHFQDAIERVIAGLEKRSRRLNPLEKEIVAYHECGHAIVAAALPTSDPVRRVSVVPRGIGALGYTLQVPIEDRFLLTRRELSDRICGLLGGRAAEHVVFSEVSTGAQDDLRRATDIARRMLTEFGMNPDLGLPFMAARQRLAFLEQDGGSGDYSDATAEQIDQHLRTILGGSFEHACAILETNRELLTAMAMRLLEAEVLEGDDLDELLGRVQRLDEDVAWQERTRALAAERPPIPTGTHRASAEPS